MIQEKLMNTRGIDGGKGIHISGNENNMTLIDSSDNIILLIDDDSAVDEGFTESTFEGLPDENGNYDWVSKRFAGEWLYKYPVKGAGLSVGYNINDAGGFSAIGRKKVMSTGAIEASSPNGLQKTRLTKTGIHTTGDLYVVGKQETEGTLYVGGIATFSSKIVANEIHEGSVAIQTNNYTCSQYDSVVIMTVTSTNRTVTLYASPTEGKRVKIVKRQPSGTSSLIVTGSGGYDIVNAANSTVSSVTTGTSEFLFTGGVWQHLI